MSSGIRRYDPLQLYPTHVFHSVLNISELIKKWKHESLKLVPSEHKIKSFRGNRPWCSDDNLHLLPQFKELKDFIILETNYGLDWLGIERDEHYISGLWLNAQYQNNNHSLHTHANSLFSGVVYIDTPENSQSLVFRDPRPQTQVMVPSVKRNPDGSLSEHDPSHMPSVTPRPGSMYFWPSWLPHSTYSDTDQELERPRLTMAFNIMIRGKNDAHSARFTFA